jgi:succinate dehydrogenase / fumarate reductase membrane anchor subunit
MFMRYSGVLLIPLALSHIILNDVIVGVHAIDLSVVAERWTSLGWRLYSASLLVFAFAHGMNGVRQVAMDYIKNERTFRVVSWVLLIAWFVISMMGAIALVGGVRQ